MKKPKLTQEQISVILGDKKPKRKRQVIPPLDHDAPFSSVIVNEDEDVVWNTSYENGQKRILGYTKVKRT